MFFREKRKINQTPQRKGGVFENWRKCHGCRDLIHIEEIKANWHCCPHCNFHFRISAKERIAHLADKGTFQEQFGDLQPLDTIDFTDRQKYRERLANAALASGQNEAICLGTCQIDGVFIALGALDFAFMAGSMGSVVGEKIALGVELAAKLNIALVLVSTSGGARMQETIFSLMQMAKTAAALAHLDRLGLPYISVLTDPTCGGVTASFAALGDVIIAEPGALICFAGPRLVEQTTGQILPRGAQKSEFLLERGMIDCISARRDLKKLIGEYLHHLAPDRNTHLVTNSRGDHS